MRTVLAGYPRSPDVVVGGGSPVVAPTVFGAHPSVAANLANTPSSIFVDGNSLYLGYGDWLYNTGPVDLAALSLEDGSASTPFSGIRTESNEVWRRSPGGYVYNPWVDTDSPYDSIGGGCLTNQGGTWHEFVIPDMEHVFDIAVMANGDLIACGARRSTKTGCVVRSQDDGGTWSDLSPSGYSDNRVYVLGDPGDGYLYIYGANGQSSRLDTSTYTWEPWTQAPTAFTIQPERHKVVLSGLGHFVNGMLIRPGGDIATFSKQIFPCSVENGVVYGVHYSSLDKVSTLLSTASVTGGRVDWTPVCNWVGSPRATVYGGSIYIPDEAGVVLRATLPA